MAGSSSPISTTTMPRAMISLEGRTMDKLMRDVAVVKVLLAANIAVTFVTLLRAYGVV